MLGHRASGSIHSFGTASAVPYEVEFCSLPPRIHKGTSFESNNSQSSCGDVACSGDSQTHGLALAQFLGWNVAGVSGFLQSDFLQDISSKLSWTAVLVQEWTNVEADAEAEVDGHRILQTPPFGNHERGLAIIVNKAFSMFCSGACQRGRSLGWRLCMDTISFWLVTAHLPHSGHGEDVLVEVL